MALIETSSSPIWHPVLPDPPPGEGSGGGSSGLLSGTGAPDNALGNNGNVYVNLTNGDVYSKAGDVWIVSGGTIQVLTGDFDDPNSNVTPSDTTQPAFYYKDSAENIQWRWIVDTQVWEQHFG